MRKFILIAAAGLLATSCGSTPEVDLDTATASTMSAKTVAYTRHDPKGFQVMTLGRMSGMAFGAVGGAVSAGMTLSAGDRLVATYHIEDPANAIGADIAKALEGRAHMQLKTPAQPVTGLQKPPALAAGAGGADFILDVTTTMWGYIYFGGHPNTFHITYYAEGRLIDAKSAKVVAMKRCHYESPRSMGMSQDELLKDDAANLKRLLELAHTTCGEEIQGGFLHGVGR